MSRRNPSVDDVLAGFERGYTSLAEHERRELDDKLLESRWFRRSIKIRMFFDMVQIETLGRKNSRGRPADPKTQKRNDELLAEHESETPPKSPAKIGKARGLNKETVRSGINEAMGRRDEARAKEERDAWIIETKKKVHAQLLEFQRVAQEMVDGKPRVTNSNSRVRNSK